ncbi:CAAX amino protease [Clostridia bacterium]|nr:CAAX amino protease [Clostridia bacterium]
MEIKPPTTLDEQIEKLKERGCIISDEPACKEFLRTVNYYRLTAYFLPFREESHKYKDGTTFERVKGIYEFDKKLRAVIFAAVEDLEIYMRARLSYYHAHKYGALGYLNAESFGEKHSHDIFLERIDNELSRNRNTLFVKHHREKYEGKFPIWVIIELFSFGMLSHFYADMPIEDKKAIAVEFGTRNAYLESWLHVLTVLRNTCAHYGRLYCTSFDKPPKIMGYIKITPTRKLFTQILTLKLLSPDPFAWNNTVLSQLTAIVDEYTPHISLEHIGFTEDWQDVLRTATTARTNERE